MNAAGARTCAVTLSTLNLLTAMSAGAEYACCPTPGLETHMQHVQSPWETATPKHNPFAAALHLECSTVNSSSTSSALFLAAKVLCKGHAAVTALHATITGATPGIAARSKASKEGCQIQCTQQQLASSSGCGAEVKVQAFQCAGRNGCEACLVPSDARCELFRRDAAAAPQHFVSR
jgi:hypothetical protein